MSLWKACCGKLISTVPMWTMRLDEKCDDRQKKKQSTELWKAQPLNSKPYGAEELPVPSHNDKWAAVSVLHSCAQSYISCLL